MATDGGVVAVHGERDSGSFFSAGSGLFSWASSSAPATGNHAGRSTTGSGDANGGMAAADSQGGPQSHSLGLHSQPHSQSHHGYSHSHSNGMNGSAQSVTHTPRQAHALSHVQTVNSYSLGEHDSRQQHLLSPGDQRIPAPQEYQSMLQSPVHLMQPRSPFGSQSTPASAAQHLHYQQQPQQPDNQIFSHNAGFTQEQQLTIMSHPAHVVVDDNTPQQALYSHPHLQHLGLISPQQRTLSLKYPTQESTQMQGFQYMPHSEVTQTQLNTPVGRQLRSSRTQSDVTHNTRIEQTLATYEAHESGYDTQASTWHDAQTLQQLRDGGVVNQGFSTIGSSQTSVSHRREEAVRLSVASDDSDIEADVRSAAVRDTPSATGADVADAADKPRKRRATPFAERPRKSGRPKDFVWGYFNGMCAGTPSQCWLIRVMQSWSLGTRSHRKLLNVKRVAGRASSPRQFVCASTSLTVTTSVSWIASSKRSYTNPNA